MRTVRIELANIQSLDSRCPSTFAIVGGGVYPAVTCLQVKGHSGLHSAGGVGWRITWLDDGIGKPTECRECNGSGVVFGQVSRTASARLMCPGSMAEPA